MKLTPAAIQEKPRINLPLFDIFLYVIASISAVVSGYNSFLWFNNSSPVLIAIALSVLLVSCSIIFPAVYRQKKNKAYLRLAFVTVGLSIFATIAGQYSNYSTKHAASIQLQTESGQAGGIMEQLKADELRLTESKASLEKSKAAAELVVREYLTAGWWPGAQQKAVNDYQTQIIEIDRQLSEISTKKMAALKPIETAKTTRKDFYSFLAGIFKISADIIELIISCIFAGFIDIVCPLVAYNIHKE